jgi:GMP synthase (glutamine-hydrolysing)
VSGGGRVLVVEHEADDPVHLFGQWLRDAGMTVTPVRPYRGEALPASLEEHDALLVMGGAMGADDDDTVPWLTATKQLLRDAVVDGVPTLGICLGHQLASSALGGTVVRNPGGKQFGLLTVGWTEAAADDELVGAIAGGDPVRALQWNDDVVAVPPDGADVLARAATGEVQMLRFGPAAWGVQWHPEVDEALVGRWTHETTDLEPAVVRHHLDELAAAREELEGSWRPLAEAFAAVVVARSVPRSVAR